MTNVIEIASPNLKTFGNLKSKDVFHDVISDIDAVDAYFKEKQETRSRNFRFFKGNQWTSKEENAIKKQFRIAYKFNEIKHKVEHLLGSYTQTRMDSKCVPREYSDSTAAELLNFILKWVEQVNKIEYIERDVFRDGVVGAVGAAVVRWEFENLVEGYPKIEKVPADELVWDMNAKELDLSDARWMARIMYVYRDEAKEMFPEHSEIISEAVGVNGESRIFSLGVSDQQRKAIQSNRTRYNYGRDVDLIRLIEYYRKEKEVVYVVIDQITGDIKSFEKKKDASEYYEGLLDEYIEQGQVLDNQDGTSRVVLTSTYEDCFSQTIIIGNEVAENNKTDLPFFPWIVFFAYFHDGDHWSFVDDLIDPQILINRSFSMWDYQLGSATKNLTTIIPQLLAQGFPLESFRREASKNHPIIPVRRHDALQQHQSQQAVPQLFDNISFGIQRMNDYAGGKNALGLQENAAESGRAVIARAEQGGLARLPLFDNLKIWRQGVTERVVWWIKNYMSSGQVIRIIGEDQTVRYLELDDSLLDTLQEIKTDVVVEEAAKSETVNERYFQQLKELFAVVPGVPPEVIFRIMLPYSSLPETKKEELLEMLGGYQEYMSKQEAMKKEDKLKGQVQDQLYKKQLKEQLERQDEIKRADEEANRASQKVRVKLDEVEQMQQDLGDGKLAAMMGGINTKEEMNSLQKASMLSKLLY